MTEPTTPLHYRYRFRQNGMETQQMDIVIDPDTMRSAPLTEGPYPDWTRLEVGQCDGCLWKESDRCPVAVRLVAPIETFLHVVSFEAVEVEVTAPDRTYLKQIDMQQGLSAIFGLLMATSGCPSLAAFRPMARFHLPFASFEETFFRVLASCLVRHFVDQERVALSRDDMIEEVNQVYAEAAIVNDGIMQRLRIGISNMADSSPNAVALLAAFSGLVPLTAERQIRKVEKLFSA